MDEKKTKAREISEAIRDVLLHEWDPIGVANVPEAQDEYDGYVGVFYRLLSTGASMDHVADELQSIVSERMGLQRGPRAEAIRIAKLLMKLEVRLNIEKRDD